LRRKTTEQFPRSTRAIWQKGTSKMPTRIRIQNVEPQTKIGDAVTENLVVKQTGGGPPQTSDLPSGGSVEMVVEAGRKVTVQVQGEE
jgi:hypothetical protein